MKPNAFRLIVMTIFGSAGMAALTLRVTGSLLLAFLTYSIGGAALMMLLAAIMFWRVGKTATKTGATLDDWELDRKAEGAKPPRAEGQKEKKRDVG